MSSVTLSIEGMHCTGCAGTIELLLTSEPGVRDSVVSFESKTAQIVYDNALTSEERLAAVIEKAGFRVSRPA